MLLKSVPLTSFMLAFCKPYYIHISNVSSMTRGMKPKFLKKIEEQTICAVIYITDRLMLNTNAIKMVINMYRATH